MKFWKQTGLAILATSLMMGYGQVSAQVHNDTYSAIASTKLLSKGKVGVPSGTILDAEKKRPTGDEIMAEFDALLEQNPLVDLRQTIGPEFTVKQLSSSKLAQVGKGYVYANLGTVGTTVGKVKDYARMQNMKEGLKLGRYMDVYELQGADQYGVNTAWVLVFPLPKELLMSSLESYGKEGFSPAKMEAFTNDTNAFLKEYHVNLLEDRDIDYSQNKVPAKIRLRNLEPLHTLPNSKYGTMTTAGTMTYDIKGVQYPAFLRIALVGTPEYLTTIVMGTSEVEGTFFKPYFLEMLQHIE